MLKCSTLFMLSLLLLSACGSSSNNETETPTPIPLPVVTVTLQEKLDDIVESSTIPGAIAWLSQENTSLIAASGFADVTNQVEITTDTQMRIASMTKTLTAVTMMKLIEEGHLNLDDTVSQFLPVELNQGLPNTNEITVRHLLSMTSGFKNYTDSNEFNDAIDVNPQKKWSATEVLSYISNKSANFSPGAAFEYSNSNFVLCDIIVAKVMETSLATQMRRILFAPFGMDSSYVEIQEDNSANGQTLTAHGYEDTEDVTDFNDGIGLGDGGVVSTVADLSLFLTKVFRDKAVLNEESLMNLQAFHATEDYGLGLEKRSYSQGMSYAHSGASSGFSGDMMYFANKDITWVLLTNQFDTDDDFDAFPSLSTSLSE